MDGWTNGWIDEYEAFESGPGEYGRKQDTNKKKYTVIISIALHDCMYAVPKPKPKQKPTALYIYLPFIALGEAENFQRPPSLPNPWYLYHSF